MSSITVELGRARISDHEVVVVLGSPREHGAIHRDQEQRFVDLINRYKSERNSPPAGMDEIAVPWISLELDTELTADDDEVVAVFVDGQFTAKGVVKYVHAEMDAIAVGVLVTEVVNHDVLPFPESAGNAPDMDVEKIHSLKNRVLLLDTTIEKYDVPPGAIIYRPKIICNVLLDDKLVAKGMISGTFVDGKRVTCNIGITEIV